MDKLYFIKDIKKSNTSCKTYRGFKSYIDTGSVQNNKIVKIENFEYADKPSRANVCVKNGDVIFAKMQNSIKVVKIDKSNCNYIYSTGFYCFEDNRIKQDYLKYFLMSPVFNHEKDKRCTGSTQKAINDNGLKQIFIPVPSLSEQENIIEELDLVSSAFSENKKRLELYDEIISAKFNEMFGHPLQNENKYECKKLSSLCKITDGAHNSPKENKIGYPMLSVKDMENDGFYYKKCKHIKKDDYEKLVKSNCKPKKNDVLIAKDGSYFKYGFVVENEIDQAVLSSIAIITPDISVINPYFLTKYLLSKEIFYLVEAKYITGAGIRRVILEGIKEIPVMLPPLNEQNKFEKYIKQIKNLKQETQSKIKNYQELLDSKMNEYFNK